MTQLHETYIKKYVSSKDYSIVHKNAVDDFDDQYNETNDTIICKSVDFILFMMSRKEFMGLIRYTVILFNKFHDIKIFVSDKHQTMSKKAIVDAYTETDEDFKIFLTASLYSYV